MRLKHQPTNLLIPSQYCGTVRPHQQMHFPGFILGILNNFTEGPYLRGLTEGKNCPAVSAVVGTNPDGWAQAREEHWAAWWGAPCSLISLSSRHRATHWLIHTDEQGCTLLWETSGSLLAPRSPFLHWHSKLVLSHCPQYTELPRSLCVLLCDNTNDLPYCWQQTWEMFQHNL